MAWLEEGINRSVTGAGGAAPWLRTLQHQSLCAVFVSKLWTHSADTGMPPLCTSAAQVGICGEQGGEPKTVAFLNEVRRHAACHTRPHSLSHTLAKPACRNPIY